jgi:hypothetical protein
MWMLLLSVSGRLFHRWFAVLKVRWLRVSEFDWKTVPDCICFISRVELGGSHGTLPQFVAILTADVDVEEHTEVGAETKFRGLNRCELFTFTRLTVASEPSSPLNSTASSVVLHTMTAHPCRKTKHSGMQRIQTSSWQRLQR